MISVTYVLDSFSVLSPDFARVRMIPGVRRFLFLMQSSEQPPTHPWCGGGGGPQDDGLFQLLECQMVEREGQFWNIYEVYVLMKCMYLPTPGGATSNDASHLLSALVMKIPVVTTM